MGKWTVQWVFFLLTGIRESLSLIIPILWGGIMFYLLFSSITLWGLPALYFVTPFHLLVTKNYAKTLIYDNQIISVHRPVNKWRQIFPLEAFVLCNSSTSRVTVPKQDPIHSLMHFAVKCKSKWKGSILFSLPLWSPTWNNVCNNNYNAPEWEIVWADMWSLE